MKNNSNKTNRILEDLERGYDQMAQKFSDTRSFFWRDLNFIADYVKKGDRILDFGCGNGRLFEFLKDKEVKYYGADVSRNLIEIAREKYPEIRDNFFKIDGQASLPFSDNFFNAVFSIAVFHHFPDDYAREAAKELHRVIKPGGVIVVTAWNLWQGKNREKLFSLREILKKILKSGESGRLGFRETYIDFKNNQEEAFSRYHRAYTCRELAEIFSRAGFRVEKCEIVGKKNLFLLGKK